MFILVGQIAGRAYKVNAEASIFRRGRAAHLIDTPAGRIGIGICVDNQFATTLRLMDEQRADLILMPHAWPTRPVPRGWSARPTLPCHRLDLGRGLALAEGLHALLRQRTVNTSRAASRLGWPNEAKVRGQMPAAAISVPMP